MTSPESHVNSGFISVLFSTLLCTAIGNAGEPAKLGQAAQILVEARTIAATISEKPLQLPVMEALLRAQIPLDPAGARETLRLHPGLPNRPAHLASLASVYAKRGDAETVEHLYAEILIEERSARGTPVASIALNELALAYANAGKIEEAFQTLSRVRDKSATAVAGIAEAQFKKGDVQGAIQTALTVAVENPQTLMNIIEKLTLRDPLSRVLEVVSRLDEGAQRYAQWGIVRAQIKQSRLRDAQVTASAIKPGHAKAGALLELANHHLKGGASSVSTGLLQEAAMAARSTVNEQTRADILRHIAVAMAEVGETFTALETIKSIENGDMRRESIRDIVRVQARQGDVKGAFNNALLLKEDHNAARISYESAISDILAEWSKAGKAKEAREAVKNFEDLKERQPLLYIGIAAAQADVGNIQDAKSTLFLAETPQQRETRQKNMVRWTQLPKEYLDEADLRRLEEARHRESQVNRALESIAKAQCKQGGLSDALTTAGEMGNRSDRSRLIQEFGPLQVQAGRTQAALAWCRALPSPSDKAYALIGVAQGLFTLKSPKDKP